MRGILITLLIFSVTAIAAWFVFDSTGSSLLSEQAELLNDSIYSAVVNCYAVTGHYPTLEELTGEYGIVIDTEHFSVYYSSFASNVMPDIRVSVIEEEEGL